MEKSHTLMHKSTIWLNGKEKGGAWELIVWHLKERITFTNFVLLKKTPLKKFFFAQRGGVDGKKVIL